MDRRVLGGILSVVGLLLVAISALADAIGIGDGGFGWKQTLGVIVGAVVMVAGLIVVNGRRPHTDAPRAPA